MTMLLGPAARCSPRADAAGSGRRMSASLPEPSWARSRWTTTMRFSDLDMTFGIAGEVAVAVVLDDWTRTLVDELDAVQLADLQRGFATYRVFLLPEALQFDLSMTPAAQFRPAGPRFRLVFGETAEDGSEAPTPAARRGSSSRRRRSGGRSSGGA